MKTFKYYCVEIYPDKLDFELEDAGKHGWELILPLTVQRYIQPKVNLGMSPAQPQLDIKFLLIFKKEIVELKN